MASFLKVLLHPIALISSLWKSAPNIPVPINLAAASPSPGVSHALTSAQEQVLIPSGLCGWVANESGNAGSFVCQAMGQVMPGVVFFVSMTVFIVTFLFLIRYIVLSKTMSKNLEELSNELVGMKIPTGDWASEESFEKICLLIAESGKRVPPLEDFARRLKLSVVSIPPSTKQQIGLKESVATLSLKIRTTDRWSGRVMAETLPGWLTGIGLLTTFLAILLGLQGVKVLTTLEVLGIGGLVNGLSGKFFSSIVALACAIGISITHYFVSGSTDHHWNKLVDRLQALIPHISIDQIFLELMKARNSGTEK